MVDLGKSRIRRGAVSEFGPRASFQRGWKADRSRKGDRVMPLVTIKVFDGELSESQSQALIRQVTEAIVPFVGEKLRDNTWVLIEEINSGSWGIGGRAFGLKDVRAIQSQK